MWAFHCCLIILNYNSCTVGWFILKSSLVMKKIWNMRTFSINHKLINLESSAKQDIIYNSLIPFGDRKQKRYHINPVCWFDFNGFSSVCALGRGDIVRGKDMLEVWGSGGSFFVSDQSWRIGRRRTNTLAFFFFLDLALVCHINLVEHGFVARYALTPDTCPGEAIRELS